MGSRQMESRQRGSGRMRGRQIGSRQMHQRGSVAAALSGLLIGVMILAAACGAPGAEESASVEILPPTEPAQVMGGGGSTAAGEVVTATPEQAPAAAATSEASTVGSLDEVTLVLGFDFPFPQDSTVELAVELAEDDSLAVVDAPYTWEEATGITEGTMAANGYELVDQTGSAEEELIYTFRQEDRTVTITLSPSEAGSGTRIQFAAE